MCSPSLALMAVGTLVSAYGQIQQGKSAKAAADYQAAVANNNAIIAGRQADDARKRGEIAADQQRLRTRLLIGQQRATLASSGVLVDTGSALDLTAGTAGVGELDALTIQSNAEREALGFETQGMNFTASATLSRFEGQQAVTAATTGAFGTLVTGGGKVAGKWAQFDDVS